MQQRTPYVSHTATSQSMSGKRTTGKTKSETLAPTLDRATFPHQNLNQKMERAPDPERPGRLDKIFPTREVPVSMQMSYAELMASAQKDEENKSRSKGLRVPDAMKNPIKAAKGEKVTIGYNPDEEVITVKRDF